MIGSEAIELLEACPLAAIVLDTAEGVAFANRRACEFFGSSGSLVGTAISDLLPDWQQRDMEQSTLPSGAYAKGGRPCEVSTSSHVGPDGPVMTVWIRSIDQDASTDRVDSDAEVRLRYMIDMLPQAVCVFDAYDRYVLWNRRYEELYAEIADHLRPGVAFEDILRISLASGRIQEVMSDPEVWVRERMAEFRQQVSQEEQQLRDGRWLRHDDRRTPDGGAIGLRIDITDLKQREEWLKQLFEANPMPMLLCDWRSLSILEANRAAVLFYGFGEADLLARKVADLHVEGQREKFRRKVVGLDGDCDASTVWCQHVADGSERHVLIYVRLLHKGTDRQLLLTVADVSDRVSAELEATRLANHDVLTGLPNRIQFYKALDEALRLDGSESVVVCCLDLDGFKPVNDVFGHAAGDEVLRWVGERLRSEARGHMVARLGGDEFAILVNSSHDGGTDLARRCVSALHVPFVVRDIPVTIGVSIGIASARVVGAGREILMQAADAALYEAKALGRNTWHMAPGDGSGRQSTWAR